MTLNRSLQTILVLLTMSGMAYSAPLPEPDAPSRDERMAWRRDAGFGMFIHGGLYSIPAGDYEGRRVRGNAEWIMDKLGIRIDKGVQVRKAWLLSKPDEALDFQSNGEDALVVLPENAPDPVASVVALQITPANP